MKKLLLLLCFLPVIANAQNLQIGFNAGTDCAWNTVQPPYVSLKVLKDNDRFAFGGSIEFMMFKDHTNMVWAPTVRNTDKFKTNTWDRFTVYPHALINYKVPIGKHHLYGGAAAGYFYQNRVDAVGVPNDRNALQLTRISDYNVALGAQIGAVVFLSKKLDINAELAYRASIIHSYATAIRQVPASIGVRYKL